MVEEIATKSDEAITLILTKKETIACIAAVRLLQIVMKNSPRMMKSMGEVQEIEHDAIPSLLEKISKATGHGGSYDKELKLG